MSLCLSLDLYKALIRLACSVHLLTACRGRVFTIEASPAAAKTPSTLDAGTIASRSAEIVTVAQVRWAKKRRHGRDWIVERAFLDVTSFELGAMV